MRAGEEDAGRRKEEAVKWVFHSDGESMRRGGPSEAKPWRQTGWAECRPTRRTRSRGAGLLLAAHWCETQTAGRPAWLREEGSGCDSEGPARRAYPSSRRGERRQRGRPRSARWRRSSPKPTRFCCGAGAFASISYSATGGREGEHQARRHEAQVLQFSPAPCLSWRGFARLEITGKQQPNLAR